MAGANKEEFPPLLPAGFHRLDVNARRRLCVDHFGNSVTRPRIMSNLESTITAVNGQGIAGEIWIDGSFLTEKLNPDDADVALVLSPASLYALSPGQRQFFDNFSGQSLYDRYRIDNYAFVLDPNKVEDHWWYAYWLRQFGWSCGNEMKGIVSVSVPFVVRP